MKKWLLKIKDLREELMDGIDKIEKWKEKVRMMKRKWIGKQEGLKVRLEIEEGNENEGFYEVEVYKKRKEKMLGEDLVEI